METKPKTVAMGGAKIEIQLHEWRYSSGRFLLMAACDGFADQLRVFAAPVRISSRLGEIPAGTVPRVTTKSKIDATDGAKIETWLHRWRYGVYGNLGLRVWPRKFERCGQEERATPAI